jgi:membrane fusion protein (multidrug efflux system)
MKNFRIPFVLALVAFLALSCSNKPAENATLATVDTTIYRVKTIVLEKQSIAQNIEFTANLLPFEEINYAPASPGRIEEIKVEIGSRVKKGDVIARMEQTQLIQANEQLLNARSNFQRMDTLFKLNSISEQQYEAAKTQYEVTKSGADFLTRNTTLVSPINGIVTGKYFESGELYSGAPNTPAGKAAIVTLMQINPLKVTINVSERYYPVTKTGLKVQVKVDIFPNRSFSGEVSRIYPTVNSDTRTFPVEIIVKNDAELLRPGMFARVTLNLGEIRALIAPAIAVIKQEGTNDRYVFLAGSENKAHKIPVNIGARYDDKIEIISDTIKEGDLVIVAGQEKLMDQTQISIVQ